MMKSKIVAIRGVEMADIGSKRMAGGSRREGKFKCKICRMIFDSKDELKLHFLEDHNDY